jgi:hypothetical protein
MPKKTTSLASKFTAHCATLERTRSKMEVLLTNGRIELSDIEQVYAGLYLDLFTEFEAMIEELFFGLLRGQLYTHHYKVTRKVKLQPASEAQKVVYGGRSYLDWLPYNERTVPRANIYFDRGLPFTALPGPQKTYLNDFLIIRNALAHKTSSAQVKFQSMISGFILLPQEETAAGYLRSKPYSSSPETQYQIAAAELQNMIRILCA